MEEYTLRMENNVKSVRTVKIGVIAVAGNATASIFASPSGHTITYLVNRHDTVPMQWRSSNIVVEPMTSTRQC